LPRRYYVEGVDTRSRGGVERKVEIARTSHLDEV
jgi:hypothetical protein